MFETANISIFAGSGGRIFAERMCNYMNKPLGSCEVIKFSEGNTFVRVNETVRDRDIFLVQPIGMQSNDEFVEILFWMDAFKRANALSCTLIMPYFGYGKGDKKDEPRVSIRARVCAECMELAGADRFVTMDLHAPQLQGFWKKPVDHLYALPMLTEVMKRLDTSNAVVVSPDAGFAKQARKFADALGLPIAIGDKTRTDHLVNRDDLKLMKPGAMIIDVACDDNGAIETCSSTSHDNPVYFVDGILHYAVDNIPSGFSRTSSQTLSAATLPYALAMADKGVEQAMLDDPHLCRGLTSYRGMLTLEETARKYHMEYTAPRDAILKGMDH